MKETKDYLQILRNDMHSVIMATADKQGHPVTRVIDIMLVDDTTLYFLTARGKAFYEQLMHDPYIALTGMCGGEGMDVEEASLHKKAISIHGKAESIGKEKLDEIFEKNPYMASIYPDPLSRQALEVFRMTEGRGEFFDLSTKPITRAGFHIGLNTDTESKPAYFISDKCMGCGKCVSVCPQKCIVSDTVPYVIQQEHCLHCGNCFTECPVNALLHEA